MSTVGEVADRVFRDWLHSPEDQPVLLTLDGAVDDSTTSWGYDTEALAPDEEDLLAPGVLVEAGSELARITAVDDSTDTLTVVRGVNGTTAASHADGAQLAVAPTFARSTVVEAVKDNVRALHPSLWHVNTETLTTASTYIEVPADVVSVVSFLWKSGENYINSSVELRDNFPPSSTDKAIVLGGEVPKGRTAYLTYRSRFARPATESTDLSSAGVAEEWERIVAVGAAAQVVAGRDLDALTVEYITEQLQRDALPVDAPQQIRNGLLTLHGIWLEQARRNLRAEQPIPVIMQV